jgi:TetR/AcrR family transcriptional regulator, repressor for uid operon
MPKVVPQYKEQARARIVDAAAAVFRRRGIPGGTMDEIAREIGVSKGALYLYFPTKTRLLAAVQEKFRAQYLELLERELERGDVAQGIAASVERILMGDFDPAVWHQLVSESLNDPEVREVLREDEREDRKNLRALLERLRREGRIRPAAELDTVVEAVLLLLQGTFNAVALRAEPETIRGALVRALRLVLGTAPLRPKRRG